MSVINFLSSFLFKRLSFFSCVIATLSLTFRFAISFSLAIISTSLQIGNTEKKLLNRSIAKCYSNRWKANKISQNSEKQLEDPLSIRNYCKLVIITEKKIKLRVEKKLKTLDKKYKKLINKSRPPLHDLSEEDIKLHKETQ